MSSVLEFSAVAAPALRNGLDASARAIMAASRFGSSGNLALAACLGVFAFAWTLMAGPLATVAPAVATAPAARPTASAPAAPAGAQDTPASFEAPAPVGQAPGAIVETALDYDVAFYWPQTPQTVTEPVAIRSGPATWAQLLRSARPGERLRINGRVEDAPGGPWYRVRLADGRDGYLAARTTDVGSWRRKRAAEARAAAETAATAVAGAPLAVPGAPTAPDAPPPAF